MKQYLLCISLLFGIFFSNAQTDSTSFGIRIHISNGTLMKSNGKVYKNFTGNSYAKDATGYASDFSIGLYNIFYDEDKINLGLEFFYDRTSSKQFPNSKYSALNLAAYMNYNAHKISPRLFFDMGFGLGYITNHQESKSNNEIKADIFIKLGCSYNIHKGVYIEFGGYPSITEIVDNYISRRRYYFGMKIALDGIF